MWSKTRRALTDRLADNLKKRVSYSFAEYLTNYHELPVFFIRVDKKTWFISDLNFYNIAWSTQNKLMKALPPEMSYNEKYALTERIASEITIRNTGFADIDTIMKYIHEYLNELSIDECLSGENCFHYLLAILDRRVGKRRVKAILDNIENEPEWIRRFILLRAEVENLI